MISDVFFTFPFSLGNLDLFEVFVGTIYAGVKVQSVANHTLENL